MHYMLVSLPFVEYAGDLVLKLPLVKLHEMQSSSVTTQCLPRKYCSMALTKGGFCVEFL